MQTDGIQNIKTFRLLAAQDLLGIAVIIEEKNIESAGANSPPPVCRKDQRNERDVAGSESLPTYPLQVENASEIKG